MFNQDFLVLQQRGYMKIVEYSPQRSAEVADVLYQAVHAIQDDLYSQAQRKAWTAGIVDSNKWQKRLLTSKPYLLLIDNKIAGFIELDCDGYIGCLYVAPAMQRRGVASSLLQYVMNIAVEAGLRRLSVHASIVAKPFFEKFYFEVETENKVMREGIELTNYSMYKQLSV
jgi:ribosomal protein S18 acetylase RimI-like enzyme